MGIRAGLLRRLVQSTGYTIVDAEEVRRLRAQCGTLRAEKDRIQTRANQYHDQASKLAAHKYSLIQKVGDASMRALKAEGLLSQALHFGLMECESLRASLEENAATLKAALERAEEAEWDYKDLCEATGLDRDAALALPVDGEPTEGVLEILCGVATCMDESYLERLRRAWRAGHAAGVAASQPTAERATSAQLHAIADHVVETHEHDAESLPHAVADAVAAHVRKERSTDLVELLIRAAAENIDVEITPSNVEPGTFNLYVCRDGNIGDDPRAVSRVPTHELAAKLAMMMDPCTLGIHAKAIPPQDENVAPAVEELGALLTQEKSE